MTAVGEAIAQGNAQHQQRRSRELVYELPLLVCRGGNVRGSPTTYGCGLVAVGEAITQGNAQHQQRRSREIVYELPLLVCREANVSGSPTTRLLGMAAVGEAFPAGNNEIFFRYLCHHCT